MANLKLDTRRNMVAVTSDTIDIPSIMSEAYPASTATATTANKLVDSSQDFESNGVSVGDIIQNHTDATKATVTAIDSATTLSISADIMANTESYSIYTESSKGCVFYVGVSGTVKYTTIGGDTVTMVAAPVGWHPVEVVRIWATGTAATDLLVGW